MKDKMSRRTANRLVSSKGGNKLAITEENSDGGSVRYCSRHRCSASLHSMRETLKEKTGRCKSIQSSSQSRSSSKFFSITYRRNPCPVEKFLDLCTTRTHEEETTNPRASDRQGSDVNAINVEHDSLHGCRLKENEKSKNIPESRELRRSQRFSESNANGHRTTNLTSNSRSSSKKIINQRKQGHQESKSSIRCNSTSEIPAMGTSQDTEVGVSRNGFRKFRHSAKLFINRTVNIIGKRSPSGDILSPTGRRTTASVSRLNAASSNGRSSSSTSSRNQYSGKGFHSAQNSKVSRRDARSTAEDSTPPPNCVATELTQDELYSLPIIPTGWGDEDSPPCSNTNEEPLDFGILAPLPQMDNYPTGDEEVSSRPENDQEGEYEESPELGQLGQYGDQPYLQEWRGSWYDDQYGDMRMDIDNMSYEELLALGETIGTVSTAPSEEVVSECLKRSYYSTEYLVSGDNGYEENDIKCSICQQEYDVGEELGQLVCQHSHHLECIQQWLRLKNWCPVCKTALSPTS